jgi:hypothetical protein
MMSGMACTDHHANDVSQRRLLQHTTKQTRSTYYYDSAALHLQKALLLQPVSIAKEQVPPYFRKLGTVCTILRLLLAAPLSRNTLPASILQI